MTLKTLFANYGLIAIIAVLLLVLLPPLLLPYMGVFGTYATYIVTGVLVIVAKIVADRAKKFVE